MALFPPVDPETEADRERYLRARLAEVMCGWCTARVLVKKNSDQHTVVQWTGAALSKCAEFARMNAAPGGRPTHLTCSRLGASIERAVAEGTLEVGAADGY